MNVWGRLKGFVVGQDEALNALGGGKPTQTISGTAWRAFKVGKWWGWPLVALIDALLGEGHCQAVGVAEG